MGRARLLTGGPTHPFAETAPLLVDLLDGAGYATEVTQDARAAVTDLAGLDLLVVHALAWRMEQDRYAQLRAGHAVALDPGDLDALDRFVRDGGGLLALHTAVICFDADPVWRALVGATWDWDVSAHPPLGPVDVDVTDAGRIHPLTSGLPPFTVEDEAYGFLDQHDDLDPLLTAAHGGRDHPLLWARAVGEGRVVTDLLGHGPASFEHPVHRRILTRAATWATDRTRSARRDA